MGENYSMSTAAQPKAFGKSLRESDFLFASDYLNLNHGSFGTYPLAIRTINRQFQDQVEARPDRFIRYDFPVLLDQTRAALAEYLRCDTETITLVPNATTGVDTVLMNLAPTFKANDRILYLSHVYGACEKCVMWVCEKFAVESVKIECTYPVSDDEILQMFEDAVKKEEEKGNRVVICLFDTLSSMPAMRLPFERMIKACREKGIYSLVDGAHGAGQLDLNLKELDPDFFVSNCHKWLLVPRGCAAFYVPLRNQHLIRTTLPTSHGFLPLQKPGEPPIVNPLPASTKSPYILNFQFVGTIDSSPYLCIPAAIKYRKEVLGGEQRIREYCETLAREAAVLTQKRLGTEILSKSSDPATAGDLGCFMANVRLPLEPALIAKLFEEREQTFDPGVVRDWTMKRLMEKHGVFCAVFYYRDAWWYRLSAQVYLEIADFEVGVEKILHVCEEVRNGAFLNKGEEKKLVAR